jgi:hypothetical protein
VIGTSGKLEELRPSQVQRDWRAGNVRDVGVHEPLAGHEAQERALEEHGPEHAAGGWSALLLALRCLGSDQLEPPEVVALTDRKGHQHPGVDVPPRCARLLLVQGDGHEGAEDDTRGWLATTAEQVGVPRGDGREQHVIDRGPMGVGHLLCHLEGGPDDPEPAVRANPAVDARPGGPSRREDLPRRGPRAQEAPGRGDGLRHRGERTVQFTEPPAQVVPEQPSRGREPLRHPRWRLDLGWVGDWINERAERGHSGNPVGDCVVHLDEEPDPVVREARQEPHLPQRPAPVEWVLRSASQAMRRCRSSPGKAPELR